MDNKQFVYTQNRELSWLKFNQRVLEEATDDSVPLLERMKFIAIFTSNLDEFFMIRVGSLVDMTIFHENEIDVRSGLTPKAQLERIFDAVRPLYKQRDKIYTVIKKQLNNFGILGLNYKELDSAEKKFTKKYFVDQVLSVLSPQIVDAGHPFPHLRNNEIYVIANLMQDSDTKLGIVPVPDFIPEILYMPSEDIRYIRMEKIILEYVDIIFENYAISDANYIRVTRNADVSPDDEALDVTDDYRNLMKKALHKRKRMMVVRLESADPLTKAMEDYFCEKFNITAEQIYRTKMPMKLDYVFSVADSVPNEMKKTLIYPVFSPQYPPELKNESIMKQVKKEDILLSYPYESMEPFLNLLKEASVDPSVLTIKITIYRLANKATIVKHLCAAAENGKEVTALIELRARFDEERNISWSEVLEDAGCRVIYGFDDYKVHSKVCLITYRHKNEIHYITQIGTGNYNEKTASMYTDFSLMTNHQGIGEDTSNFFQNLSICNLEANYSHLLVAPFELKTKILSLMDEEIAKGKEGRIIMKMNSLTDIDFIEKLIEASSSGVSIDLIVRGICCILPGIEGVTENIRIRSVVGRFLEHGRIFSFGKEEEQKIYIGSADMMTRNTEKRIEVACPVYDTVTKNKINHFINTLMLDTVKGRILCSDGSYCKIPSADESMPLLDAQQTLMNEAMKGSKKRQHEKQISLEKQTERPDFFKRIWLRLKG